MTTKMKESIIAAFWFVVLLLLCVLFFRACTSPEMWYAGEHDKDCEVMLNGGDYEKDECGCYDRLIEADRKRREDLNKKNK